MLDGAGDAQGHIDARMHGLAGLTDLMIGGQPARIGHSARSAHDAAQHAGQLFGQADAFSTSELMPRPTETTHVGADEVDELLGALLDVEDLDMDIVGGQGRGDLFDHDLGGAGLVIRLGLHDAGADGGHLRAEARAR